LNVFKKDLTDNTGIQAGLAASKHGPVALRIEEMQPIEIQAEIHLCSGPRQNAAFQVRDECIFPD
jgi:hypothetical protein